MGEQIAATPAKLEKVRLLAEYLRTLDGERLRHAATFFTGKPFAQTDQRTLQTGWAIIYRALLGASQRGNAELRRIASSHGDASKTALEALEGRTAPEPFSLGEAFALFEDLHKTRGPVGKTELLQARLQKLSPLEGQYVVKILTGDLRIGLREGLVEEAIARAFDAPLDDVKEAHMLLGDIGQTALLASRGAIEHAELTLFRPIKCMLASPEPTAEAIWARFAAESPNESVVYVEDKFDGIRAQLHRGASRVEIFSRDLRRVTGPVRRDRRARPRLSPTRSFSTAKSWPSSREKADLFRSAKTARTKERERRSFRRGLGGCAGCFRRLRFALAKRPLAPQDAAAGAP